MLKRSNWAAGQLVTVPHVSNVLRDNPLGDPAERVLSVWLPPGYNSRRRYPVLVDLVGYTGAGPAHTNWQAFSENVPQRLDRLVHERRIGPCIVVFPDCFTALGGNQYINSSAIGRYADYLTRELVPLVDREFSTAAHRDHRAVFGKSSGGYGAMLHGMLYPDVWGAIGNHSGDAYFEFVYASEWPAALTHLTQYRSPKLKDGVHRPFGPQDTQEKALRIGKDDGRVRRFLDAVWQKERPTGDEIMTLMMLAMAATYDPDPRAPNGFRLPYHMDTGVPIARRWERWRRFDPINMISAHASKLRSLRGIYMDCGWRDQYHIHFGMRQLSEKMSRQKITHRYSEFDDTHSGIDYRMEQSLPYLYRAIR